MSGSVPLTKTLWFLDYDGSLCPHQEVWEARAYNPEDIYLAVKNLAAKAGEVFWNTGRRPESLYGVHPEFRRFAGYFVHASVYCPPLTGEPRQIAPDAPKSFTAQCTAFAEKNPRYNYEIKPTSLRFTPLNQDHFDDMKKDMVGLKPPVGWRWVWGSRAAELFADNFDKGAAVLRELENRPEFIPVAVGDELLDRPAIEAALRMGGYAFVVGQACGFIAEIPHSNHQLVYCDDPADALQKISECVTRGYLPG